MRDLHRLIKEQGETEIANALSVSVGSLRNKRSGQRPLTIDELFLLCSRYGSTFDLEATVKRIGGRRFERINPKP